MAFEGRQVDCAITLLINSRPHISNCVLAAHVQGSSECFNQLVERNLAVLISVKVLNELCNLNLT